MGKAKNGVKKIISLFMAIVMAVGMLCANVFAFDVVISTTTWNMSDHGATTADITTPFEWNNLSIEASKDKVVKFDSSYLVLTGAANTVSFKVAGDCKITVKAKNNSTTDVRYIKLTNSSNTQIDDALSLPISGADTSASFNYTGNGDTLKFASAGGRISIKSISVAYNVKNYKKGDLNNDGSIDEIDASLLMRYISQNKTIDDAVVKNAANANNDSAIDVRDAIWILSNKYEASTETTTIQTINTSDGTVVRTYDALKSEIAKDNAKIYVQPVKDEDGNYSIKMTARLQISNKNVSVIGVPDENGQLPVLDFENMSGTDITETSSGDIDVGVRITSSGNTIKNLVIEKAHDNGIQIKGSGATGNLVENCIIRYNNDSGIQMTGNAKGNTLKNVYSYRNCDVFTRGSNADGFAIKLGAGAVTDSDATTMQDGKNICIDCYSWENGDDGWDSFDKTGQTNWTYVNYYTNCMGWNNGTAANCLGYTDYINSEKLDENLPFMMRFKALYADSYKTFVTAYNSGKLCSRTASANTYYSKLDSYFTSIPTDGGELSPSGIVSVWQGNPNCFKLGSANTQSNSLRYLTNCIAFDHESKGVDENGAGANIYANNIISFDNKINYYLAKYTAKEWTGIYGWSGTDADKLPTNGTTPSSDGSAKKETIIREAAERLKKYASNNTVVASNVFENVF